jgi:hypothetical protein
MKDWCESTIIEISERPELTEKIVGRWGSGVLSLPHTPGLTPGFCGVVVFYCFVLVHVCSVTAL